MESTAHTEHGHEGHHGTPSLYLKTYAALVVLMFLTIFVSRFYLGPLNNVIAMGIALTKATLVVLFFMQVRYSTKLTWVWAALGFIWLSLMFGILGDYVTRTVLAAAGWTK
jgi:cytochrome c oxidase subunit 4